MPTYDLGMTVATGAHYNSIRHQIEAPSLKEACAIAEDLSPGYKVHQGWCIEGGREPKTEDDLHEWMSTYQHGVLRTQHAGPEGKKE